ncbi:MULTISPECIES: alpha-ketoacid dehydrogenase subunit beta [Heyndrickxia]|jgi:2-oxoisovalerate dehydrogenase E1 component beta subunit|uniref:Branched-chain alpha-keto acid dehydrogenase, E1 component, beta subunit n=2 Tax=Heyndrickxia coagulans TaxID=1398 RepID=A0A150JU30_HEYCO|nr:alpha-ketoacid dehydrogenase subunit beta [Heyndrickxia coagulans]AEH53697.1 Transketolase central region [Heyndrickxia coagulans 2-6]AJH77647.1 2-oxoisovalerate dehydrogenase subunit beta [Heyndrickxia coagulans DSM 1 = ATCC 7050]AVD56380.1 alpha-ketoacid dehydrogenase subunit beta [Heyndrickxia coagulans]KYC60274.1 Branched-chain alpha-keto acid dehydrogenase, E1 component, beta subunit [Heyndrickxia coagulans]MBF8419172.1 alpha-ketoacid dehydrogenase subunit beta [Heyndrickxia coagulans]
MAVISYIDAITKALREEMERDEKVFVLGEDVGKKGGVFKATAGLYEQFGAERVIDTPLAESAIAGVGVGAAMYGMRPVAEIQFADFILPAVNQIISEAAKIRYRTNNDWQCPLVVRAPYGGGVHGALYHSQSLESVFANQPGLKIVMPSTPYDVKGLLKAAIRDDDPVLFFEHKRAYRLIKGEVPDDDYVLPIGKAEVKREGTDITVITYGLCVHFALQAAEKLREDGIEAHILDLRTVYPLDKEAIIEAAAKTGKVLLVTEDNKEGSIIGEVAAIIAENCLFDLDAPIMRLAGPDVPAMPYAPSMEKYFMVNPEKVEKAMRELAEF